MTIRHYQGTVHEVDALTITKDGSMSIVEARVDGRVHVAWLNGKPSRKEAAKTLVNIHVARLALVESCS